MYRGQLNDPFGEFFVKLRPRGLRRRLSNAGQTTHSTFDPAVSARKATHATTYEVSHIDEDAVPCFLKKYQVGRYCLGISGRVVWTGLCVVWPPAVPDYSSFSSPPLPSFPRSKFPSAASCSTC